MEAISTMRLADAIDEYELVDFFEVLPALADDTDEGKIYETRKFVLKKEPTKLEFYIDVHTHNLVVLLSESGKTRLDAAFEAHSIEHRKMKSKRVLDIRSKNSLRMTIELPELKVKMTSEDFIIELPTA